MNLAHLHLLLNHFPTIGTFIAFGLFVGALLRNNDDLKRISLGIFFLIALITLPTYMSGNAAQELIVGTEGISDAAMESHEDAALLAFIFMTITGVVAWMGLWQYRRMSKPAAWTVPAVLGFALLSFLTMARAAAIGGLINHPEIIPEGAAEPVPGVISNSALAAWFTTNPWAWPLGEAFHFLGLCLLFGVVLVINLRMLGMLQNISFPALHRLLPVGIFGFVINTITGMLFFIATPEQYTMNVAFYWKVILMLAAGVNVLYFTMFDEPWSLGAEDEAPALSKVIAASTIAVWVAIIYFGRMLPYIGNSF